VGAVVWPEDDADDMSARQDSRMLNTDLNFHLCHILTSSFCGFKSAYNRQLPTARVRLLKKIADDKSARPCRRVKNAKLTWNKHEQRNKPQVQL
jgi:hypothetical protein